MSFLFCFLLFFVLIGLSFGVLSQCQPLSDWTNGGYSCDIGEYTEQQQQQQEEGEEETVPLLVNEEPRSVEQEPEEMVNEEPRSVEQEETVNVPAKSTKTKAGRTTKSKKKASSNNQNGPSVS